MSRLRLVLIVGILLLVVFVGVLLSLRRPAEVVQQPPGPLPSATPVPQPTALPTHVRPAYTALSGTEVAPIVVERSPARGEELAPDQPITIVFDREMDQQAVGGALAISPQIAGTFAWSDARTVSFRPEKPWNRNAVYDVVLGQAAKASDGAQLASPYQFRFATTGYLEVAQVIPAPSSSDIAATTSITILFNRPVVALTTVEEQPGLPQPLRLVAAGTDQPVAGTGEWLNTSVYVFHPAAALRGGQRYTGHVDPALRDTDGNPLQTEYTWEFAVATPQVLATLPAADAKLVDVDGALRVDFNQPVTEAGAVVRLGAGSVVPGTIGVLEQTLIFTPSERLRFDTLYTAEIPAGTSGLVQPYRWSFRTVPLPRIISTTPADGEQQAPAYSSFQITFNTPIDPTTVERNLRVTPAISPTQVYTGYNDYEHSFYYSFGAQPSTDYTVAIGPDIADPYGNRTGQARTVSFRTAPLPPSVRMVVPDQVGTYNAAEPTRLVLQSVNTTSASMALYRITIDQLIQPDWYSTPPSAASRIRDWTVPLNTPLNEQTLTRVNLVEGGGRLAPGAYLVALEDVLNASWNYHTLVVSDINLTLKSGEREALVWANRLSDGQPVANLPVTFYTGEKVRLGTATTDANGIARLAFEPPTTSSRYAIAETPFAGVGDGWSSGISPYEFGVNQSYGLPDRVVTIYTERAIYRPGQTIHFKGVVRNDRDVHYTLPTAGEQINLVARSPDGQEVYRQSVALSALGTFDGEIKLSGNATLGTYYLGDDQSISFPFTVAAYRAPEFEVVVTPPSDALVRGTPATTPVDVRYFFGGPVAGVPVQWNVLAEPYHFSPSGLEHYTFSSGDDPWLCFDCWWMPAVPPRPILSGTATTGADGRISIALPGELQWDDGAPITTTVRLQIEATASGKDNQVISGRAELIVHPAQVYTGLAARSYVSTAGQAASVDLVAVDLDGKRRAGQSLEVEVQRYEWTNRFIADTSGSGHWESNQERIPVAQQTLTTNERGEAVLTFTPDKGGSYRVIARTSDGTRTAQSSIFLWVSGSEYVPWQRANNDRLTLISDRTRYVPGETASILIPSPFTGPTWALITVERGGILHHEVVQLTSNSTVYKLPITAEHVPNIYVGVVLFTGPTGDQRFADHKVGILPLRVDPVPQTLKVTLTPEGGATVLPGSAVRYNVETVDALGQPVAADLSLDLVDKAVLSLLPRDPDVLTQAFYGERGLGISTASGLSVSADRLLEELLKRLEQQEQGRAAAGGDTFSEGGQELAPGGAAPPMAAAAPTEAPAADAGSRQLAAAPSGVELRANFADTAFWRADFATDAQGKGSVEIELPDNLTTWVLRGVGLTGDTRVGEGTVEVIATKPLLIRPVTPRFLVVDDQVELAANVSNTTDQPLSVQVALSATGVTVTTALTQTIDIPAKGEAQATWAVLVRDEPAADLIFSAISGAYSDAARPRLTTGPEGTLPIYRYSVPETVGTGGELGEAGARTEIIALPPSLDTSRGEVTLRLDPSLAAGIRDGLDYLEHYPDEGTEQTVSSFLPNVLTYRALKTLGIENAALEQRLPGLIRTALDRLKLRQHGDGGWGWWEEAESNPHVSAYVVLGLVRTQEAGFDVDDAILQNGVSYLAGLRAPITVSSDASDANLQAFLAYVLAESGRRDGDLRSLGEFREKLSTYGRALLAMAAAQARADDPLVATLLSDIQSSAILSATGAHWEEDVNDWWAMNTDTRSTAIVLQALARLDPENQLNPNVVRWLMVARKEGIWETTQETAWSIMALTDWMAHTGELKGSFDYAAAINDRELMSGRVEPANVDQAIVERIPIAELLRDAGNRLMVGRGEGPGILYYTAHLRAFLPVEEVQPLDRGFDIRRRYTLASCTDGLACPEVKEVKVGDVIRVDLTLISPHDRYYLRLEDPLPAGAEAIDTGLATTSLLAQGPGLNRQVEGEPVPWMRWWNWYSRSEIRDEKVVLFAPYLSRGTYEYSYTMRATQAGTFHVIPTTVGEVYFPEVYGRGAGQVLVVR